MSQLNSYVQGKLFTFSVSVKQIGKIAVNRNAQNIITKTHTYTPLKAVDFGFRTKKKGQAYNASIQSKESQRSYDYAKSSLIQQITKIIIIIILHLISISIKQHSYSFMP